MMNGLASNPFIVEAKRRPDISLFVRRFGRARLFRLKQN